MSFPRKRESRCLTGRSEQVLRPAWWRVKSVSGRLSLFNFRRDILEEKRKMSLSGVSTSF